MTKLNNPSGSKCRDLKIVSYAILKIVSNVWRNKDITTATSMECAWIHFRVKFMIAMKV